MATHVPDLKNKTVVVLGASSGFGRGTALKLGELGANVVIAARRGAALDHIVTEINSAGGHGLAVPMDISDPGQVAALANQAIERFGTLDVWINNVGIGALGFFWDIPVEDHARVIDVNLKGLIYGAHAAVSRFRIQGFGTLVNVGSIDSEVPLAYQASYAASKAGVLSLSRSLNEELRLTGSDHIKVATIMPWAVDTPWWLHAANYTGHAPRMAAMDDPELVVDAIISACVNPKEEMPVGWKAHASNVSHHMFPDLTERLSAKIADQEVKKAQPLAATAGALHDPMAGTEKIDGGIRARMKAEDESDDR
jgi:NAD(P)-dependent dehydrogenase (short-subunit alcohol dehydrogenase family)